MYETFPTVKEIQIAASGLLAGDVLQVTTGGGSTPLLKAETDGKFKGTYTMDSAGFARVEILRGFIPGLPLLPALNGPRIWQAGVSLGLVILVSMAVYFALARPLGVRDALALLRRSR